VGETRYPIGEGESEEDILQNEHGQHAQGYVQEPDPVARDHDHSERQSRDLERGEQHRSIRVTREVHVRRDQAPNGNARYVHDRY